MFFEKLDAKYPKGQRHMQMCLGLNELYIKKNHDYGDSFHKSFLEEGMAMPRIRLGDKYNRFCALTRNGGQQVNDESIKDTLFDLANYAIMTLLELDDGWYAEDADEKVELVRCKDCGHYGASPLGHPETGWCKIDGKHRGRSFYCANGERKGGKNNETEEHIRPAAEPGKEG